MGTTTQVFGGSAAAVGYAAFNLRDEYYRDMANFVADAAKARLGGKLGTVVDLGAGIGISTMEIAKKAEHVIAVEPEEAMRYILGLNVMGDPRVSVREGKAENLSQVMLGVEGAATVDAVTCCQMIHLFNPPDKPSIMPAVLEQISKILRPGGVVAFDLGPSNYEFKTKLSDHRAGVRNPGEVLTELAHPLYQRIHKIIFRIAKLEFPDFDRPNLWPPAAARMSFKFLSDACKNAGLKDLKVREDFSPVSGKRVVNFIRNGWTVFFRWGELSNLSAERKLALMEEGLKELFLEKDFAEMQDTMSYHPTAVFTAVKS